MNPRRTCGRLCAALIALSVGQPLSAEVAPSPPEAPRLRVLIETDAGGDPDDEQSLVRFLLYANEWDVEGIVANRPRARDGENRNPERTGLGIVRRQLRAYAECYPTLVRHDVRYPAPDALWQRTVAGDNDTDAAVHLILAAVDGPDPRPLWYSDWGSDRGAATNNLRRALDRVRQQRGPTAYAQFKSRLRLASFDNFAEHTSVLDPPFPIWVNTFQPEREGRRWYHRFAALTATAGGFDLVRDVLTGHGPLGALYPTHTGPPQKEGDTMSFLYLAPTGMNDPEHPHWGSWAGRYGPNERFPGRPYFWANQTDAWQGTTHRDHTLARWAVPLQNDFRARLDWCVAPRAGANHPPHPAVNCPGQIILMSGEHRSFNAEASSDPDGHALRHEWAVYPEAGTFPGPVRSVADGARYSLEAPAVTSPETLHIILAVTDDGQPPLTRYARIVSTVVPQTAHPRPGAAWRLIEPALTSTSILYTRIM